MNLVEENFELEPWRFVILDIAYSYGLEIDIAKSVVSTLNLKSLAELDARYIGHYSVYNNIEELEHDIYEVYGEKIPFAIIHNLIIAAKPLCDK